MKDKHLITVVGPTAIGKTSLSISLAKHFNCDILSCDSRQFFKEMEIGTAVPSKTELLAAKHHFIQNKSIFESYSVGDFEKEALYLLDQLYLDRNVAVMVGGSGLYVDAVINGLDDFPKVAPSIREELKLELEQKGIEALQHQLAHLDRITFHKIDIDNPQRIIRALEICIGTGQPYSSFLNVSSKQRNFKPILIGLEAERATIYDRINQRVDLMIEEGLVSEAEKLFPHRHLNALQTVGYKELFDYFEGNITLEFAISEIKKNTRRFAKRQLTWFRKNKRILWFNFQEDPKKIIQAIEQHL